MVTLTGKYAMATIFSNNVEPTAMKQILAILNCPAMDGSQVRIMPDVHAGVGAVIGFTATLTDKVIPNMIGVDIGCGVHTVELDAPATHFTPEFFVEFDKMLRNRMPSGFSVRNSPIRTFDHVPGLLEVAQKIGSDPYRALCSIGTLGGGNHFIEIGMCGDRVFLTVHTGSRNFGLKVATYHQNKAIANMGKLGGLEWLEGDDMREYLHDMTVAQHFAKINRSAILGVLLEGMGLYTKRAYISVHNFIGEDNIIRKGAISAKAAEPVVVPWNMRDGMIIGTGKGNADWNNSAPHGAGRKMGRGDAKRNLSMDRFTEAMEGVWSSCVSEHTLDEAPDAYKDHREILEQIEETVDVECAVRPVYNFKA